MPTCSSTTTIIVDGQTTTICYQQHIDVWQTAKELLSVFSVAILVLIILLLFVLAAYGLFLLIHKMVCKIMSKRRYDTH